MLLGYGDQDQPQEQNVHPYGLNAEDNLVEMSPDEETGSEDWLYTGRAENVDDWPAQDVAGLGEVAGVATDLEGNPVLFHRASREWQEE